MSQRQQQIVDEWTGEREQDRNSTSPEASPKLTVICINFYSGRLVNKKENTFSLLFESSTFFGYSPNK